MLLSFTLVREASYLKHLLLRCYMRLSLTLSGSFSCDGKLGFVLILVRSIFFEVFFVPFVPNGGEEAGCFNLSLLL